MWQRFTERARRVILLGQQEAGKMRSGEVGTEHLLLGLLRENEGVAAQVLQKMGVTLPRVRLEIEAEGKPGRPTDGEPKLTPKSKRVLELSADEARRMRHNYIGTEHLLLALLREKDGLAAMVLRRLGLNLEQARQQVLEYLGPEPVGEDEPRRRPPARKAPRVRSQVSLELDVTPELQRVLEMTADMARELDDDPIGIEHLLLVLWNWTEERAGRLCREMGLDLPAARARVAAHLEVTRALQRQFNELNAAKEAAVDNDEYEKAAELRAQADEIAVKLTLARESWQSKRDDEAQPGAAEAT